ncbi:MAG: protein translocase subunit SecD [Chloroflexota bacterium]|nr:protein translocase subunit SecD [Chloroflexota bacterium]
MSSHVRWLMLILALSIFCIWVASPPEFKGVQTEACSKATAQQIESLRCSENLEIDVNGDGENEFVLHITQSLGLDLVGGLRVLLQADIPTQNFTREELAETANNVSRRVNALGLTEATVQVQGRDRILVELPGVRDPEQAIATIQQTALLEFVDFGGLSNQVPDLIGREIVTSEQITLRGELSGEEDPLAGRLAHPVNGLPFRTVMTGAGLQAASAVLAPAQGTGNPQWLINFEIKEDFQNVFGSFTGERIGQPMAIVLDGEVLSAPTIQAQLSTGGVISGQFTEQEANTLALQLRSGALPIPLRIESTQEVGATLGQESVRLSVQAGVVGVLVVLAFMFIYYRLPGLAADLALIVFIFLNIAVFKLLPVTLTLPAITGFLISIGTAVDGNILIFERIKEELRAGLALEEALKAGFDRAWTSIRDSNLSTIIICGILFMFGQTPGASIVAGFAVTLAIGLVLNLFTAVIVTRSFLYILVSIFRNTIDRNRALLGV